MTTMIMKGTSFACDICESTWKMVKKVYRATSDIVVSMGYARAAHQLANQGMYKEARYLMLHQPIKGKK